MSGGTDPEWNSRIEELSVRPLIWLVAAVIGLLAFLTLVALIPSIDRVVPGLPLTIAAAVNAFVTLVIALLLIQLANKSRKLIQGARFHVTGILTPFSGVVFWLIVYLAVLIAFEGFRAAVEPLVIEFELPWTYDLAFFVLAVIPIAMIAINLLNLLDPLAEFCVGKLRGTQGDQPRTVQTTLPIEPADNYEPFERRR